MIDEMTMLRDAGTDLDPQGAPPAALRERVVAGFTPDGSRADGSRADGNDRKNRNVLGDLIRMRERRPVTRRLVAVGGVAAALTAGLVVAPTLGTSGEQGGSGEPISAAAAAVLQDAAAFEADREPWVPRDDQFVYREYVNSYSVMSEQEDGTGLESMETATTEEWLSVDGLHTGFRMSQVEAGPQQPDGALIEESLEPCAADTESWCRNVQAYPSDIPTDGDADAMLRYLRDNATATVPSTDEPEPLPDSATFRLAEDLLAGGALPPQAKSALFEAVALIPGVTVSGDVVDAAGRPGVAVGFTFATEDRDELIFDRTTNQFLGFRQLLPPDALADGVPATEDGAGWELALLSSEVVDHVPEAP